MDVLKQDRSHAFSCGRRKEYPNGDYELLVCSRPIFRVPGWEEHFSEEIAAKRLKIDQFSAWTPEVTRALRDLGWDAPPDDCPEAREENVRRAARRAASRIRDIALCNDMAYFVTLTLDQTKIDRYDIKAITKKLNGWLDNLVRRQGLKYVIVPERHKDGAYHFHGLINEQPKMVSSGTWIIPGKKRPVRPRSARQAAAWRRLGAGRGYDEVFNWEAWPLGFTTAIRLYGDYHAAVGYVCKYISKQAREAEGKIAGRWYFSGGDLLGPVVTYPDISVDDLAVSTPELFTFEIPEARARFGLYRSIRQKRIVASPEIPRREAEERAAAEGETISIFDRLEELI